MLEFDIIRCDWVVRQYDKAIILWNSFVNNFKCFLGHGSIILKNISEAEKQEIVVCYK